MRILIRDEHKDPIGVVLSASDFSFPLSQPSSSSATASSPSLPPIVCDGEIISPVVLGDRRFPTTRHPHCRQCLALGMAKHKTTFPRPSSMRLLRNLSALSRPPTPSPALLVILAGLVGSINAVPVACLDSDGPPPFLCPSLHPRAEPDAQDFSLPSQTPPPSASVPGPSRVTRTDCPTSPAERNLRRDLAPGYTQGPDGRWRKLSTWSLYGSTICVVRGTMSFCLRFRILIFFPSLASVMMLLVRSGPSRWTTLRPPLPLHYPMKPTCSLPGGQGPLKRVPPGQSSSSRFLSYSPHSYPSSSSSSCGGGGGTVS